MAKPVKVANIQIDMAALNEIACEGAKPLVDKRATEIHSKVQALSAGFKTRSFYKNGVKDPKKGGKTPVYKLLPAERWRDSMVALVVTGNYAAMKFEHENNGLLKASR